MRSNEDRMEEMKTLIRLIAAAGLLACAACSGERGEDVVADVNGYKISEAEFSRYIETQVPDLSQPGSPDQAQMLRLTVLREVIDRHIMLQRAERLGLRAADAEVEARLDDYRAPFRTPDEFQKHLDERAVSLEALRVEFQRTLTIEKLLAKEIASKMSINETEMRKYYEENKAGFNLPEQQIHLAQILVTATPEIPVPNHRNDDARDAETAQAKAEMLLARLGRGEPFDEVARNYSEDQDSTASGGDLGFIPQSFLEETDITLRRVVASLSPGEISPIIRLGPEFRILQLISREPAGQREFSDPRVQQSIRETLRNRKDQLLRTAYTETLRNEADVTNYLARRIVADFGIAD